MKSHLKKNDAVVVISGSKAGQQGKVLQLVDGRTRALVEGVNLVKRHEKKSQGKPEGGISEREAPIHVSNLMLASRVEERRERRERRAKAGA